jgi:hypothetical protein
VGKVIKFRTNYAIFRRESSDGHVEHELAIAWSDRSGKVLFVRNLTPDNLHKSYKKIIASLLTLGWKEVFRGGW